VEILSGAPLQSKLLASPTNIRPVWKVLLGTTVSGTNCLRDKLSQGQLSLGQLSQGQLSQGQLSQGQLSQGQLSHIFTPNISDKEKKVLYIKTRIQ
jgi:hypothetical protein